MIFQIVLQLRCSYLVYTCRQFLNNSKYISWIPVAYGFGFMGLRRVTALLIKLDIIHIDLGFFDRVVLPLAITILLYWGFKNVVNVTHTMSTQIKELSSRVKVLQQIIDKTKEI